MFKFLFILLLATVISVFDSHPHTLERAHTHAYAARASKTHIVETIILDPQLTNEEINAIRDATSEWEKATNKLWQFDLTFSHYSEPFVDDKAIYIKTQIVPVDSDNEVINFVDMLINGSAIGFYDEKNWYHTDPISILMVRDRIDSQYKYKIVVEHEIAHSIGFEHIYDTHALEYGGYDLSSRCISQLDLKEFCLINDCPDFERLHPCVAHEVGPICSKKFENVSIIDLMTKCYFDYGRPDCYFDIR